jgi:P-type conjugative transfer protein TrbG
MKRICLFGVLWAIAQGSRAQEPAPTPAPALSVQEAAGVGITRQWAEKSYAAMAQEPGPDGAVQFRYGEAMPTIVAAVLNVTDVELQPGEIVNEVKAGDSERWLIEPAVSGDETKTEHIVIKPKEPGLQTSLIVTTDRRTYHLRLVSHDSAFMAHVSFIYPSEPAKAAAVPVSTPAAAPKAEAPKVQVAMQEPVRRKKVRQADGKAVVRVHLEDKAEDDGYLISGKAPWKPGRVYNDGTKTYIELPKGAKEVPVLFALRKGGFLGLGHQKAQCNFRVHGQWLVADAVLDKAVLVSGVGSSQEKVTISRASK